jgi:tetratricopeptide (TPR) repeat protein
MNRVFTHIFFFFFSLSSLLAQTSPPAPSFKVLSLEESASIEERISSYNGGIHLADSLYTSYHQEKFSLETAEANIYEEGLTWIRRLYIKSQSFRRKTHYCQAQIQKLEEEIKQLNKDSAKDVYQDLMNKADQYFLQKNYVKAKELYQRALSIKPSDKTAIDQIKKIDAIFKNR